MVCTMYYVECCISVCLTVVLSVIIVSLVMVVRNQGVPFAMRKQNTSSTAPPFGTKEK